MKLAATVPPPLLDRPRWQSYGLAAVMLAAAVTLGRVADSQLAPLFPLATSYVAVALAAWLCGCQPAALAALAGFIATLWPYAAAGNAVGLPTATVIAGFSLYAVAAAATIFLCESLRRVRTQHAAATQRAAAILENMNECFCSLDAAARLTYLNPAAEKFLRLSAPQARGQTLSEALPHLRGSACERLLEQALRSQERSQFECVEIVPDHITAMSATPLAGGLALFLRDITAEKRQVQELEQQVAQRTAELHEMIADLETFSYTLVHDLRAPLRTIRMFVSTMMDSTGELPDSMTDQLQRIGLTAARMDRLILDVLNFSRLTRQPAELRPVDLDVLVREVIAQPPFSADKADIQVEGTLPRVCGNEALLGQCFFNLLQNATKFVAPGVKPRIRILGTSQAEGVRVVVEDNGIGVAPEAARRIFEPFQREDARYDGSGLGLAIVRKVIERLAGRVGVEPTAGNGSRFWFELPGLEPAPPRNSAATTERAGQP